MPLICLFGPDGSGKSTLAKALVYFLKRQELRVMISWMRGTHTLASILARLLSKFRTFQGPCNPYYHICIPSSLKALWIWIEFYSMLPILFLRFILPRTLGYLVVAERGLIDFLVWITMTTRQPRVLTSIIGQFTAALARKTSTNIYIRADLKTLQKRRQTSSETPSLSIQLKIYDAIAKAYKIPTVDASNTSIAESIKQILEQVLLRQSREKGV
ncbi:MAG: hypothetical protein DRN60_04195 [Thaumarchaeota archaeon]|nr:MAG: hypothetical protein DRN60_04195 [Nitrososphaerota archaeon]